MTFLHTGHQEVTQVGQGYKVGLLLGELGILFGSDFYPWQTTIFQSRISTSCKLIIYHNHLKYDTYCLYI